MSTAKVEETEATREEGEKEEAEDEKEELLVSLRRAEADVSIVSALLKEDPTDDRLLETQRQLQDTVGSLRQYLLELQSFSSPQEPNGKGEKERGLVGIVPVTGLNKHGHDEDSRAEDHSMVDGTKQESKQGLESRNASGTHLARRGGGPSIHPRNRYATEEPNFAELAELYPSLGPYIIRSKRSLPFSKAGSMLRQTPVSEAVSDQSLLKRATIDFTDPHACRELTRVLLLHDFNIKWGVPDGALVPALTNRLNYLAWLQDLLVLDSPAHMKEASDPYIPTVLDIGCGANLIYPLLGAATSGWRFVGADVSKRAVAWAERNRSANPEIADLIEVRLVKPTSSQREFFRSEAHVTEDMKGIEEDDNEELHNEVETRARWRSTIASSTAEDQKLGIISHAIRSDERFTFTMCNPPFFEGIEEAGSNPATAYGGSHLEMAYPGGELAFVRNMVEDSKRLWDRIHWFTTMLGKKATMKTIRKELYHLSSPDGRGLVVRTTEFAQGKTMRWGIAWSFIAHSSAATRPLEQNTTLAPFPNVGIKPSCQQNGNVKDVSATTSVYDSRSVSKMRSASFNWQIDMKRKGSNAPLEIFQFIRECLSGHPRVSACVADPSTFRVLLWLRHVEEANDADEASLKRRRLDSTAVSTNQAGLNRCDVTIQILMHHSRSVLVVGTMEKNGQAGGLAAFDEVRNILRCGLVEHGWRVGD